MFGEVQIPPAFLLIIGGVLLPVLPKHFRSTAFLAFSILSLAVSWTLPLGTQIDVPFLQYTLTVCKVDELSRVFGIIFSLITFAGGVYGFHVKETGQQVAALLYAGGALGVTFAGDFLTLIMFWELMAVASTYLIWARRTKASAHAGMRYLLVHLFGGSVLLAGILLHISESGSLEIVRMTGSNSYASWLILGGVALNTAIPPLHAWLADAYPRATVTGAVFLSAFTTKSAVYVLARVFPGTELLVFFGVMMALYGVVYAVLANDIREILAYHIISQVGYMVAGIGIGTAMALNGTAAHAFSHILYKSLLFMGAGVVLHTTGKSKLTELGGLAKSQPVTLWLYMIGAFSISGFPLFNGFISKSMIVSAAGEANMDIVASLLLLASVGTFLHTGLKLPYFTWFGEDAGITPEKPPVNMHIGMGIVAFFCILFGIYPSLLYNELPFPVLYEPYTLYHLAETTQILVFTFVAFWVLRAKLAGEATIAIDTDWFYRKPAKFLRTVIVESTGTTFDWFDSVVQKTVGQVARYARNPAVMIGWKALGTGDQDAGDFDPDLYRYAVGGMLFFVLLSAVAISLLGFWMLK